MNYYNEWDAHAAQWLKNLIAGGWLPPGIVDTRSITEVMPSDLDGFKQCHFFAGIGGWSLALGLAGWRSDEPVWTGSCPCQPYSVAGAGAGGDDPRALWWAFRWLISQRKPAVCFGEQVAGKDGRGWLAGVRADLERMGYAVGAADLCAAGVGAPHIRQRLIWVANGADGDGWRGGCGTQAGIGAHGERWRGLTECGDDSGRADGFHPGSQIRQQHLDERGAVRVEGETAQPHGVGMWGNTWIPCSDGKARRIEPRILPLAHGVPGRVGLIRGYGNAINPQVVAEFISAYMECRP